ncbi:hypothetical protein [Mycobacterium sp. M23085]|uniref:hypothetical protein n=1 Tax=Mycobacterium sp. M23085 TaxID=3378087 RepID=UPI003878368B
MRTPIKKTIAVAGGATAVVLTVEFGAANVSQTLAPTYPSAHVATPQPGTPASGVHIGTLASCIPGANC